MRKLLLAFGFTLALHVSQSLAAPCAGFSDVQDTDVFCPSVEFLKNRSITLGCGGGLYCPTLAVDRAQMASFLDRLASAMQPAIFVSEAGGVPLDLDIETFSCVSHDILVTDFPRTAIVTGHFSGLFAGASDFGMTVRYNTTGPIWFSGCH